MNKQRTRTLTAEEVARVLAAVAELEGWNGQHDSIQSDPDTGWAFAGGNPAPSRELMDRISRAEGFRRGKRTLPLCVAGCGRRVRSTAYVGYEERALCHECEKHHAAE